MGITVGGIIFVLGGFIALVVCYIWLFIILIKGILNRNFKTRRFFVAAAFYAAIISIVGYYFYIRINVYYFVKHAELEHSTTPLEDLNSIRIGPVNANGYPSFCLENEGDPTRLGHRYCEVWPSPLASAIVPAGGVFETGIGQIQRWRLVTGSQECLDAGSASRALDITEHQHLYSGVTALRGMCYLLENVETSQAKYLLTGAVKPLPFTLHGDYFEIVLTDQDTGEVIDRLVEVKIEFFRTSPLMFLVPYLLRTRFINFDRISGYNTGPIPQILQNRWRPNSIRPEGRPRLTWVEEIAITVPIVDSFAIEALERSERFTQKNTYIKLIAQICTEWNFIGPALRAEMAERATDNSIPNGIEGRLRNCGISDCRDGLGRDASIVQCENPRTPINVPE